MANNKRLLTERLIGLLPEKFNVDQALKVWYMNIRENGGLRLTTVGYAVLRTLEIESWTVTLDPKKFNKRLILEMDRKLQYPYFIDVHKKQLVFFSSREAMLANLYGDLEAFLKQYS